MTRRSTPMITLALGAALAAQDLTVKAPPQRQPIVLENATLHPVSRAPFAGTLLFERGRITAIAARGEPLRIPPDAQRIDCEGRHVYPGLISANTTIGLQEIGQVRATLDHDEIGDVTPEVRAAVAVNPDSTVVPVTRSNGVLVAGVWPSQGLVPGCLSVVELAGWTWEDMTVSDRAGLVVDWPPLAAPRGRRFGPPRPEPREGAAERRERIGETFRRAAAYLAARAADDSIRTDLRWEAMRPFLPGGDPAAGPRPVFVRADSSEQIEAAVLWGTDLGLRLVIVGGAAAPSCAELLRRHDVAVIVTGVHRLPRRRDSAYDEPFRLPAELHAAGVRFCIATPGGFYNERNLPYEAATAAAHGLPRDAALRAITLSAAELLGVAGELGSLDAGKRATLIVTDGDPLETTTLVERAFVSGRAIDLTNKHTELARKYREKYRQGREDR